MDSQFQNPNTEDNQSQPSPSADSGQGQQFQPSPPSDMSPLQSPKPNKKLWLYIIIGILVAGGALGYWWWQDRGMPVCTQELKICPDGTGVGRTGPNCEFEACPGETGTSNWQTYRNEEYGFEFRYPNYLSKNDEAPGKDGDTIIECFRSIDYTNGFCVEAVSDWANQEVMTTSNINRDIRTEFNIDDIEDKLGTRIIVDYLTNYGDKTVVNFQKPNTNTGITISGIVDYSFSSEHSENSIDSVAFREILNTFKFIGLTANWQTYRNEEYGFEFKYPTTFFVDENKFEGQDYFQITNFDYTETTRQGDDFYYDNFQILPRYCQKSVNIIPKNEFINGIEMVRYENKNSTIIHFGGKINNGWDAVCNTISISHLNMNDPELTGTFNQILSTFKLD